MGEVGTYFGVHAKHGVGCFVLLKNSWWFPPDSIGMKKLLCILGLILLCDGIVFGAQGNRECPDTETRLNFVPDQLIVVFYKGTEPERIREIHDLLNVEVLDSILNGRITVIRLPEDQSIEQLCRKYLEFEDEVKAVNLNITSIRPL